jgi:fumarate hydratase, class II
MFPEPTPVPELSIVIPAWNEARWLPATLDRIQAACVDLGRMVEIVVVDNASTDGSAQIAHDRGARVVREEERCIARARNSGARAARGRFLIFVDADTWPSAELLRVSRDAMASGTLCGGGARVIFDALDHAVYRWGADLWNRLAGRLHLAAGCFVFATREAFEGVGGFSEQVYAGEEIFFSRRMKRWGRRHGQPFRVLDAPPVLTSGRKAQWYAPSQHLLVVTMVLLFPLALRSRRLCWFWYRRPTPGPTTGPLYYKPRPQPEHAMSDHRHRIEQDSMGPVEIPMDAPWGAQTQRAIDNFRIAGRPLPPAFLQALAQIKAACAEVNLELGLLQPDQAQAIVAAADAIALGQQPEAFPVDVYQTGSGTSTNMNMNEVISHLAARAGTAVHPNDHVNRGQSSNDVIPTAIHVAAAVAVERRLRPSLRHLIGMIARRERELQDVVKTGRTHLMDAMPVRMDQELSGWRTQLELADVRLIDTERRLYKLAIGATAVGTGINAPVGFGTKVARRLAQRLELPFTRQDNGFAALASQDTAAELSGQLRALATALMKIASDLRWMNSGPLTGLAEIALPALQPGSSIMPGKVNPVIPEAVLMACVQVTGLDTANSLAAQSGNFQLNVMLPLIADNLLTQIDLLGAAMDHLADKAVQGFIVNRAHIEEGLARNPILVTALNEEIGYEAGARIAKIAYAQGRPILEVAAEETGIERGRLQALLDPYQLTGEP